MACKEFRCPCGSGCSLYECCGPVVAGAPATTAKALMRSRYTAYVLCEVDHLAGSWADTTRPAAVSVDPGIRWTGLTIVGTDGGGALAAEGVVEFVADFVGPKGPGVLAERSNFRRQDGRWVYVDGEIPR